MAVGVSLAHDAPYFETDPSTACQTPLRDTVASIAGIVEAAELEVAETLAAVGSSMVAGSAYIWSVLNGWFPRQKTAGEPLP